MTRTEGLSRRDFLRVGAAGAGAVGLSLGDLAGLQADDCPGSAARCILLLLTGGPSHLDTWDLKPDAPAEVRGPFRPIRTDVPGLEIGEHFPRMARVARHFSLVRSVHHDAAPIHETGQQLLQTGRLCRDLEYPHLGAALAHLRGPRAEGVPPFVLLPGPLGNTGVSSSHGQGAGFLGPRHEPQTGPANAAAEPDHVRDRYGRTAFGRDCLQARRLVEQGVRLVTVNMFTSVFDQVTWDCHADGFCLKATLDDYRRTLCPTFDQAYTALVEDLHQRGLLETTLVVAAGEFGRTPHLNARGGRDHWPGVWTVLFSGGGVRGGRVVGSSDRLGGEPRDRPVSLPQVAATVYRALGVDGAATLPGPDGRPVRVYEADPIGELF